MSLTAPSRVIPTSINYASLSSYLSLPSTTSELASPSIPASIHIRSSLVPPPDTNNRQTDNSIPMQSAITPSTAPSITVAVDNMERQRLLRQNQEIIRLCSLKSIQIRQSETRLSELESENVGLRATLNKVQRQMKHRATHRRHHSPASPFHRKRAQSSGIASINTFQKDNTARAVGKDLSSMDDPVVCAGEASGDIAMIQRQLNTIRTDSGSSTVSKDALLQQLDCIQTIYEVRHG